MSNHASTYHRLAKSNIFDLFVDDQANIPTIAEIRRMIRKARAQSARDQISKSQIAKSQTPRAQTTRANTARPLIAKTHNCWAQNTQSLAPRGQPTGQTNTIQRQAAQNQPKKATALGQLTNVARDANWRRDHNEDPWAQYREIDTGKENAPPLGD